MTITIDVSPETLRRLSISASIKGKKVENVVEEIVEDAVMEEHANPTLMELLKPIHDETKRLGLSEEDLEELIDSELAAVRETTPLYNR